MNQTTTDAGAIYNEDYYDHHCGERGIPYDRDQPIWQEHFRTAARTLKERYRPRTVLDVGCAKGFLVEHLRDAGVEAFGVDVSAYAISEVREDIRPYCRVTSGAEPLCGQFDLITCIEVAEHMPEAEARNMIAEMCCHTDQVIFSSTDSDFEEPTHINIHPAGYWIEEFRRQGFFADRNFQPDFIATQAIHFLRCSKRRIQVGVFSNEAPNCAVASVRLAGIIGHLERESRMQMQWNNGNEPQRDIEKILDNDLFVLHREFCERRRCSQVVAAARELGKTIVFEMDDLLISVPKSNPHYEHCKALTPDVLAMLREADFVTVTTEPLRGYLEQAEPRSAGKIHVLPNYINLDLWDGAAPPPEGPANPFVIGWFGTTTHEEDLAVIKPAIKQLARKHAGKLVFKFWGYLPKDLEGIAGVQLARGMQPDLRLHARDIVNSRIDLALAPLQDNPFNQAKSDVKWLECSICYIPGIYSTISPYMASVEHGRTGWLVDNQPAAWVEAVERLMRDNPLRRAIAIQAHDVVRQKRCVEVGAAHWDALYRSFLLKGPKPASATANRNSTPRDRAAACLLLDSASAQSIKGKGGEAAKICEEAIAKYIPAGSAADGFIQAVVGQYREALKSERQIGEMTGYLKAAKTAADAGQSQAALQLYFQAVKVAEQGKNPLTVCQVILEVARAFQNLDPARGLSLLDLGTQLAKSIGYQAGVQAADQIRAEYRPKSPGFKPAGKIKPPGRTASSHSCAAASAPLPAPAAMPPDASVIIPTFNNLALTRQCLQAMQEHTPGGQHEIIIVDNASTDGTVEFLKGEEKAGRLRLILNAENAGFARACNQGAAAAKNGLLLFLNNDTRVTPGWLESLAGAVRRPETGIAGAKLLYANGRIQHAGIGFIGDLPDHPHRHAPADAPEVNQFRELDMVTGACLMVRRELFLQLAGFDETYRNGVEDVDLCLRARAAGWKVVYEPKAVVFHLEGQSAGRFNHVKDNLKIFFERWGRSFDSRKIFVAPKPAKIIAARRSILLPPGAAAEVKPVAAAWEGTFLDLGSLSHVNRHLTRCLEAQPGMKLCRVGNKTLEGAAAASAELQELARTLLAEAGKEALVTIRHQWPPNWSRPVRGALVVIQPWEYGALPKAWVKASANVEEFWVPSNYVRQVYIESGIAGGKVFVVPNGVDEESYREGLEPMALGTKKKFRFLFVGGTIHRKGPDLLLEAYMRSFTAADDVCLVIKDFGGKSVYAGQTLEAQIKEAQSRPGAAEILYLSDELPPGAMPGLFAACDCLAHPYRGEGFGLPVLEAMACGLAVIVTGGGATDDFATEEHAYRIPARRKSIGSEVGGLELARDGWLLEPDPAALAAKMKWVAGHADEARRMGRAAGEYARREWTWERAAQIARRRLKELSARKPVEAKSPAGQVVRKPNVLTLPETAKIGHLGEARELLNRKQYAPAWSSAAGAIARRPFHCEAWLMLAEIARAAGDPDLARACAAKSKKLAPDWKPARQFLNSLHGKTLRTPSWAILPETSAVPRLTVFLIVKNEERFLGRCLESVRGLAHQIVVVDTGSTDGTMEIAKKFNAEIHEFAWNDDFSAARNEALKYATGDWVLALDADEELMAEHRQTILEEMQAAGVMAYRLPIISKGREDEGCGYVPRLFRNAPGLFYVGRVHEQVFSSIEVRCRQWGLKNNLGRSVLLHHGYAKEVMESRDKIARNLRLLEMAIGELPDEPNLVMNLGLELIRSGQFEAGLEKYREAFRLMAAQPRDHVVPELRETLLTQLTTHLLAARDYAGVAELWESPFAKSGGMTASNHFGLGLACMELKRPAEAAEQMRQCVAKRGRAALSPVNADIMKAGPNHCLALCLCALKQEEAAAAAFAAALADEPAALRAAIDFARFQAGRGRPLEALKLLNSLAAERPGELCVWQLGGEIALSRPEFLEFARDWTGEAVKQLPDHPALLSQRAEALLLTGDIKGALPLWKRAESPNRSRQAAAVVLCEVLTGGCRRQLAAVEEEAVSRELARWYRSLIASGAHSAVRELDGRMEEVRAVAPGFVRVWEAATQQARGAMVAA